MMHQIEPATPPASVPREESAAGVPQQGAIAWEGYPKVNTVNTLLVCAVV